MRKRKKEKRKLQGKRLRRYTLVRWITWCVTTYENRQVTQAQDEPKDFLFFWEHCLAARQKVSWKFRQCSQKSRHRYRALKFKGKSPLCHSSLFLKLGKISILPYCHKNRMANMLETLILDNGAYSIKAGIASDPNSMRWAEKLLLYSVASASFLTPPLDMFQTPLCEENTIDGTLLATNWVIVKTILHYITDYRLKR